jgi:hypothetical protein
VTGDFAGDEVTVFVALSGNLIDDRIGTVLRWEALDFWERNRLMWEYPLLANDGYD